MAGEEDKMLHRDSAAVAQYFADKKNLTVHNIDYYHGAGTLLKEGEKPAGVYSLKMNVVSTADLPANLLTSVGQSGGVFSEARLYEASVVPEGRAATGALEPMYVAVTGSGKNTQVSTLGGVSTSAQLAANSPTR